MIVPCEKNRLDLFFNTLEKYYEFGLPQNFELVIVSRTISSDDIPEKYQHKLIQYTWDKADYCNPCLALNMGIKYSKHENVIITCPEIRPVTNVLQQFAALERGNYLAQVFDLDPDGNRLESLVNTGYRSDHPGFYFLAMYKKEDIERINGWDLDFMGGLAYEDDDFGIRFKKSGAMFSVIDSIQAEHQFHPRGGGEGAGIYFLLNKACHERNNASNVIRCEKGLTDTQTYGDYMNPQTLWVEGHELMTAARRAMLPVDVVLDIGCGIVPQDYVSPRTHICCEPYGEYVEHLQKKIAEMDKPDRTYIVLNMGWGDAVNYFPPKSVDTVFLVDVIEHLEKEEGRALLAKTENIARRQVMVFTPLGFMPQHHDDGKDAWGLSGADWQEHKSGWLPEDFGEGWQVIVAKKFHLADSLGRPLENPFGALWAIRTHTDARKTDQSATALDRNWIARLTVAELIPEAESLIAAHQADKAISMYRLWLEYNQSPIAYAIYFNLGVVLNNTNDYLGAEQAYQKALLINPNFEQARTNLLNLRTVLNH